MKPEQCLHLLSAAGTVLGGGSHFETSPGAVSAEQTAAAGARSPGCSGEKWYLSGSSQPGDSTTDKVHLICDSIRVCQLEHSEP